jgi:hypothetical protein
MRRLCIEGHQLINPSLSPTTITYSRSTIQKTISRTTTMSKLITVFGATGNQGGSVIKNILADSTLSKTFKIRGITRDVSKPAAQALVEQGVELKTVSKHIRSVHLN